MVVMVGEVLSDDTYEIYNLMPISVRKLGREHWVASFIRIRTHGDERLSAIKGLYQTILDEFDFLSTENPKNLSAREKQSLKILKQHIRRKQESQ